MGFARLTMPRLPRENNEAELQAFELTCQRLGGFDRRISFEWVDGFLTALAAGPRVPDTWLAHLCGDAFERAFADPSDQAQALRALKARLTVLSDQLDAEWLLEDPEQMRLNPVLTEWADEDRERAMAESGLSAQESAELQTGADWADGFFASIEAHDDLWHSADGLSEDDTGLLTELLAHAAALLLAPGSAELQAHLDKYFSGKEATRDELLSAACFAIQDLRIWWVDHAPKPSTLRVEKLPGRNEACWCGSGKKFKRCHGAG
jgi:uncharacterized protein